MLLDKITSHLNVTVATAISANPLQCTADYEDTIREKLIPVCVQTPLLTATTEIIPAPSSDTARRVLELHIYNADTVTHDVTVLLNGIPLKFTAALAAGKTLYYNRLTGWVVV